MDRIEIMTYLQRQPRFFVLVDCKESAGEMAGGIIKASSQNGIS